MKQKGEEATTCDCGKQALFVIGENTLCEDCWNQRKKEAKFIRDKNTLDSAPGLKMDDEISRNTAIQLAGVDPDNYDKIVKGTLDNDELFKKLNESYHEIMGILEIYMDIPENIRQVITIWIIGTYIHKTFNSYPFLFLNAMRGSGKTRLLRLISHLSNGGGGKVQTGISEAVFFRTPKHTTLVLDECEGIGRKDAQSLREYMNASYKKGATVSRTRKVKSKEGEDYEIQEFEPYKPMAMANIWGMDEVLGDRCITFVLEKSNNPGKTKLVEDFDDNDCIKSIKSQLNDIQCSLCSVVYKKNMVKGWNNYILKKYNPSIDYTKLHTTLSSYTTLTTEQLDFYNKIDINNIDGRNMELFMPLFLVADLLNQGCVDNMIEIAKDIVNNRREDEMTESRDVSLFDFVSKYNLANFEFISISDLTRAFKEYVNEGEDDDKWISTKYVGRALKRLNLIIEKRRMARGVQVVLNSAKAREKVKMFKNKEKVEKNESPLP